MKKLSLLVVAAVGLSLLACSGKTQAPRALSALDSPSAPASAEPNLVSGADGHLYLSWVEAVEEGHRLRFSRWMGQAWSTPRTIARGEDWFVNWADFPAMGVMADGTLAAHWLAKVGEGTYAYGIYVTLSHDGGTMWSPPFLVHTDGTETEHGFVSFVNASPDRLGLVWLDGRETGGGDHGHGDDHGGGGAMTLRYATVGKDGQLADEGVLDERVCDCCSTDAALAADGTVVAVYRDRSPQEIRDISVVRGGSVEWSQPQTVHADNWKIEGCPVNGPELALDGDSGAVAWFTVQGEDQGEARVAFTQDGGRTFGDPIRVDDGNTLGRVDVVTDGSDAVLVVWLEEGAEGAAELRLRRVTKSGVREPSTVVAATQASRGSGFPRMVRHGDAVFFAWTEMGEPSTVRTAVYR